MAEEHRVQAFFYLASTTLFSEMLAPTVGSVSMTAYGVYMPLLWGFPLQIMAVMVFRLISDTRSGDIKGADKDGNDYDIEAEHNIDESASSTGPGGWAKIAIKSFRNAWTMLSRSRRIM